MKRQGRDSVWLGRTILTLCALIGAPQARADDACEVWRYRGVDPSMIATRITIPIAF